MVKKRNLLIASMMAASLFAKAISGGDKSKFELLKGSIEEGFGAAAKALGGELPEISRKTYDLVMEKLDKWVEED